MHICVFTTVHPWDDVRVKSKFVDSFLAAGDSVTWVGPNRAFFETEAERDQRIQYKLVERGPGWKGRIASMRSLRTLLAETTDIDWIYTPDPDAAAIALSIRHTRVVLDLHEEYHKGHMTQSLPSPLRQLGEAAIQLTIGVIARRCALVTAVNDAILDAYRADPKRRLATFNTPPEWFTRAEMEPRNETTTTFFHGKALANNGTGAVLDGLRLARERDVDARVLMFPSPGPVDAVPYDHKVSQELQRPEFASALDLRPGQVHRAMPSVMSSADVGLIAYDRALAVGSLPNRFFEYMALGLPVIVPKYSPLMVDIAVPKEFGITADFEDPTSIMSAMEWMANHPEERRRMGARAKAEFEANYAWDPIFQQLRRRMMDA